MKITDNHDLNDLINKLDTIEEKKAWGEIVSRLITSYIQNSEKMTELIHSLNASTIEATKINKFIMFLTIAISLSAICEIIRNFTNLIINIAKALGLI